MEVTNRRRDERDKAFGGDGHVAGPGAFQG
jgi:hypothetical protein